MKKQFFRVCSILLTVALLVNMLPMSIFAQELQESLTADAEAVPVVTETEDAHIVSEIPSKRTQYSKEFLLSNGLHLATVYADPVHYEKDGTWAEIDNTLVAKSDGTYRNTAGVWNVSFPQQLSGSKCVTIEKDGYTLSFTMAGELRSSGELMTAAIGTTATEQLAVSQMQTATAAIRQIDKAEIQAHYEHAEMAPVKLYSGLTYSSIYPNTDVVYDMDANRVKESIVMNAYSSTLRGYRYTLDVGEMVPVAEADGQITFYDSEQKNIVMVMPAPYLLDANNEYNDDIQVQLTGKGSTYTLTYLLPTQWLGAAERAWPVILDPEVKADVAASNIKDHTVCENKTYSYTWSILDTGYSTTRGKIRGFLRYVTLPQLTSSDVVVSATLQMCKVETSSKSVPVEVHKVTQTWDSTNVTWATQPDFEPNAADFANVKNAGWYGWVITDIVRDWYNTANYGLMIKLSDAIETGSTSTYRQFYSADAGSAYRPVLTITFRNNNGIEGYWDYTGSSAGRAGSGYINNYTGNLVWLRDDIGFGGNRMPVTIQHVYNANDAIVVGDTNNSNDSGGNSFGMGYGWRTNYNQLVYHWNKSTTDDDYYIWEDGDGTDIYFERTATNEYVNESDPKNTLTVSSSGYQITFEDDSVSYFDSNGRLTKMENDQPTPSSIEITYETDTGKQIRSITDGAGRQYNFSYTDGLLTKISYIGKGSKDISVTFGYENSNLTQVTDPDGESCHFRYGTRNLLISAQDIDGYKLTYTYNDPEESWRPYRVLSVTEEDTAKNAEGGSLTFAYGQNQTTITDHNQQTEIWQFNDWGNTISIQDNEGHATFAEYARNKSGDTTGKANQLTLSSKLQNTVGNAMKNSSFESSSEWSANGNSMTAARSTEQAYLGSYSLKLTNVGSTACAGLSPAFSVGAKDTYTYSAYIKTVDAAAQLAICTPAGVAQVQGETIPAGQDWTRVELSYTNNTDETVQLCAGVLLTAAGSAYLDCVQLEKAPTASRYNLVENGDFRYAGSWTISSNCTTADTYTTVSTVAPAATELENTYFRFIGDPAKYKNIKQTVAVSGSEGDSFVLAGWAKGQTAPLSSFDSNERKLAVRARFNYTDGTTSDYFSASFLSSTDQWQYSATAVVAEQDYSSIMVAVVCDYNINTVHIDGIQLFKEQFGSSYTYDEDGNVISTVDLQKQTTTYEYNANGDIARILQDNAAKVTYEYYEGTHNVKTATTEEGAVYTFEYDSFGNTTKVSVGTGAKALSSSATYSTDGNFLTSTTDPLAKVTTYGYNEDTGVLEWVQYPEDTAETRTSYEYDSLYRKKNEACTTDTGLNFSVDYAYEDDRLSWIATPTSTYWFVYDAFGQRGAALVETYFLATYLYTNDRNRYLQKLEFGNLDYINYTYDQKGRLLAQEYEDGDTVSYAYDNNGDLATVTDSATGRITTYYYDLTDRMMKYTEKGTNFSHSVGYEYNAKNNLTQQVETINGTAHTTSYTYDKDNRVETVTADGTTVEYTYDTYGRIEKKVTKVGETAILTEEYTFTETELGTSTQIATHTVTAGTSETVYTYTYDNNGNILSVTTQVNTISRDGDGEIQRVYVHDNTVSYQYDSANQLIFEANPDMDYGAEWEYDDAGNIEIVIDYYYNDDNELEAVGDRRYCYEDDVWRDLLTSYNDQSIVRDDIGNPLSYDGWTYTWEHGRQLAAMSKNGTNWTYTYNADGLRTAKTNGTDTWNYVYNGSKLTQMTKGTDTLYFTYDAGGTPLTVKYNGTTYYYATNLQGDVVAIHNSAGTAVVTYTYDAWGEAWGRDGSMKDTLGVLNPLRYRGYVYDQETRLYYLQSRYYDPEIGRFINADNQIAGVGGEVLGYNMFAYCMNNPMNMSDSSGNWPKWLTNAVNWVANALGITTSTGSVATTGSSATAKGPTISRNTSLGIVSSKASGSLGYATGSFRGQTTQTGSGSSKSMIGGFGKASALNFDSQNRIGIQNIGISKKDVLDVGTVTAQAGIQYKDGLGISLGAKASVAAARGTYCVDVFGWKVEVGMSAQFLSYGYEFAYGALPEGGWGVKKGPSMGLFGYSYLIRITPS